MDSILSEEESGKLSVELAKFIHELLEMDESKEENRND
ncbi:hypothetical protein Ga0466249_002501 [Sporomusaceae bacterium BoRhaA]|nr:hypothetical protein [Pelorhabdus rhamnosifermentans]